MNRVDSLAFFRRIPGGRMQRAWYLAGWGWVAISATIVYRAMQPGHAPDLLATPSPLPVVSGFGGSEAARWFAGVRAHCNALEVGLQMQASPPPDGWEGAGYAASCHAIAGQIDRAREIIGAVPERDRANAAGVLFEVGHPIADAGDDRSAGPIMQLVVELQPWNYMALYHAGMSWYAIGEDALARKHLDEFMRQYKAEDGWRANARTVLGRLDRGRNP
jgi:hypothetical protein